MACQEFFSWINLHLILLCEMSHLRSNRGYFGTEKSGKSEKIQEKSNTPLLERSWKSTWETKFITVKLSFPPGFNSSRSWRTHLSPEFFRLVQCEVRTEYLFNMLINFSSLKERVTATANRPHHRQSKCQIMQHFIHSPTLHHTSTTQFMPSTVHEWQ